MEGKGVTAEQSPLPRRDGIERRIDTRSAGADVAGAADMVNSMAAPESEREVASGESVPRGDDDSGQGGIQQGTGQQGTGYQGTGWPGTGR